MPESNRFRSKGFTIAELVVTLVVIGVIAAIALPRTANDPLTLSAQVGQLSSAIRYAQSLAMTQGQRYRVNFSASGYSITLTNGTSVPDPFSGSTSTIAWNSGVTVTLPPSNLPNNLLAFDGLGIPYTDSAATTALAASAAITLSNSGGSQSVTIAPQTGRVTP
jgi:MSHA pilin protein MshC